MISIWCVVFVHIFSYDLYCIGLTFLCCCYCLVTVLMPHVEAGVVFFGNKNLSNLSEDSEPFVRRTSRMKKRAYERILTFGTAQSNTPTESTLERFRYT